MRLNLNAPLLLVGAGNMGLAMLAGWLENGLSPSQVIVQDPAPPPASQQAVLAKHGIVAQASVSSLATPPPVVVMAVKPQIMGEVLPKVAPLVGPQTVLLSIAAGRTIASFEAALPPRSAVVRAMPNTPASIGRGITVCVGNAYVTADQKSLCDSLLAAVGAVGWSDKEGDIDAVTAVSGSGPAYVFYLAECMTAAGIAAGLSPELSEKLARWTSRVRANAASLGSRGRPAAQERDVAERDDVRRATGADGRRRHEAAAGESRPPRPLSARRNSRAEGVWTYLWLPDAELNWQRERDGLAAEAFGRGGQRLARRSTRRALRHPAARGPNSSADAPR